MRSTQWSGNEVYPVVWEWGSSKWGCLPPPAPITIQHADNSPRQHCHWSDRQRLWDHRNSESGSLSIQEGPSSLRPGETWSSGSDPGLTPKSEGGEEELDYLFISSQYLRSDISTGESSATGRQNECQVLLVTPSQDDSLCTNDWQVHRYHETQDLASFPGTRLPQTQGTQHWK